MLNSVGDAVAQERGKVSFEWSTIPTIPDNIGFAGAFAGVSNDALIVTGGSNFPDGGAPWTGSLKVWTDQIFALTSAEGSWRSVGRLPKALGYGGSITWKNHLILIGGSNEKGHSSDVLQLTYLDDKVTFEHLPPLPYAIANTSAVLCGDVIYVAGGLKTPDSKQAENNFWALDLSAKKKSWKILPAWPGASRMLNVLGSSDGSVYLFSGVALVEGNREYLKDAYCYHPTTGWKKLADLPGSVAAAPSPAYTSAKGNLLIFGGDDGMMAVEASALKEKHPGFSSKILSYSPLKNTWTFAGEVITDKKPDAAQNPNGSVWAPVTTTLTLWNGNIIIPGGEVRPATRTPNVLQAKPEQD